VFDCDVTFDSSRLITGSADTTVKLWNVETGKELYSFNLQSSVVSVGFAHGDHMILAVQDQQGRGVVSSINLYNIKDDTSQQSHEPVRELLCKESPITVALWGTLNQTIISGHRDGSIRIWDTESGAVMRTITEHKGEIKSLQFSKDRTMFISASADKTAKLFDVKDLAVMKTYTSDRPLNAACISPVFNHVIVGGGQQAIHVTQTDQRAGHFEADFHHLVYADYMGSVKGHFGPINALAFSPDGKSFASGSEDGYVRLHLFDESYFNNPHNKFPDKDKEKTAEDKEEDESEERAEKEREREEKQEKEGKDSKDGKDGKDSKDSKPKKAKHPKSETKAKPTDKDKAKEEKKDKKPVKDAKAGKAAV